MFRLKKIPFFTILAVIFISVAVAVLIIKPPVLAKGRITVINVLRLPLRIITSTIQIAKNIIRIPFVFQENRNLKKTVGALKSRLVRFEELTQENWRLKRLLNLKEKSLYYLVVARVIGRDVSNWASSVIIDRGASSGIRKDSAVLTEDGLAGKVVEVGQDTSKVMLLNDFNMHTPAVIQRNREMGMVAGTLEGGCKMIYLPANSNANVGDIVVTSNLSAIFPKGIIIGRLISVQDDFGGLGKTALVRPAVNLASLEEVLVIVQ